MLLDSRGEVVARTVTSSSPRYIGTYSVADVASGTYVVEVASSCSLARYTSGFSPQFYAGDAPPTRTAKIAARVALDQSRTATHIDLAIDTSYVAARWSPQAWTFATGPVAQSSPVIASYRGVTFAAVGSENGEVYVFNVATGRAIPGWPRAMAAPPGQHAAIESTPAIAYFSGPNGPPSIVVGSGSTWVPSTVGEVEAFSFRGTPRWVFHVARATNTRIGVVSSPAIGDITGSGQQDVVFGSWDHRIYALSPTGALVPGFPFDNADTIWSSPALFRMPGQHADDVFVGSDASGLVFNHAGARCFGGFVGDYRYEHNALVPLWRVCKNQTIWSSPAVTMFGDAPVIVVGTGFFEQPFPSDTNKVFAFYAANGAPVPGWPVSTSGPVWGSPAIGSIGGRTVVVDSSWICRNTTVASCLPPVGLNESRVTAWTLTGKVVWTTTITGGEDFGSPILVPLRGRADNDVLVGSTAGLVALSGANGNFLYQTSEVSITPGCEMLNTPAVAPTSDGAWWLVEACGGPARPSRVVGYRLPVQPPVNASASWPMFRHGPDHAGVAP
jgi:hypothetical protein